MTKFQMIFCKKLHIAKWAARARSTRAEFAQPSIIAHFFLDVNRQFQQISHPEIVHVAQAADC